MCFSTHAANVGKLFGINELPALSTIP